MSIPLPTILATWQSDTATASGENLEVWRAAETRPTTRRMVDARELEIRS
jgi:hypothetical protein